jgi:RimJ/RimL family protein N-acetyltransferase
MFGMGSRLRRHPRLPHYAIETDRFMIESVVPRQFAAETLHWTFDPDVMNGIGLEAGTWSLKRWRQHFRTLQQMKVTCLSIRVKTTNKVIGFHTIEFTAGRVARIGVAVGEKDWWGSGAVKEARGAIVDYLFGSLGIERVWSLVSARNFASIANYHMLGFTHEGILRQHGTGTPQDRSDMLAFAMLKDDWTRQKDESRGDSDEELGSPRSSETKVS